MYESGLQNVHCIRWFSFVFGIMINMNIMTIMYTFVDEYFILRSMLM